MFIQNRTEVRHKIYSDNKQRKDQVELEERYGDFISFSERLVKKQIQDQEYKQAVSKGYEKRIQTKQGQVDDNKQVIQQLSERKRETYRDLLGTLSQEQQLDSLQRYDR